jgi:hypothetical protein
MPPDLAEVQDERIFSEHWKHPRCELEVGIAAPHNDRNAKVGGRCCLCSVELTRLIFLGQEDNLQRRKGKATSQMIWNRERMHRKRQARESATTVSPRARDVIEDG